MPPAVSSSALVDAEAAISHAKEHRILAKATRCARGEAALFSFRGAEKVETAPLNQQYATVAK